jgi:hypothetical protein
MTREEARAQWNQYVDEVYAKDVTIDPSVPYGCVDHYYNREIRVSLATLVGMARELEERKRDDARTQEAIMRAMQGAPHTSRAKEAAE